MTTLDFSEAIIENLITHRIGNKSLEEVNVLSQEPTIVDDFDTRRYLLTYFLSPFKPVDFQQFSHPVDLEHNVLHTAVSDIFTNSESLISQSQQIAKLLYECSTHPKVQAGELNVVRFSGIRLDQEIVDAVGIYKSESQVPFVQMIKNMDRYSIDHQFGFDLMGLNKGCLVINTRRDEGYRVLVVDTKNKNLEAQYWTNDFLKITPTGDGYNLTKEYMRVTRDFVEDLATQREMPKPDQIELLNRTVDYFKANDVYEQSSFEDEVFQDVGIIQDFRNYDQEVRAVSEPVQTFEISPQAVQNQSKIFKSVLKLDKNFHIYIHGNRDLIERGKDENGKKYYKVYYEEEH